jgi:plasmid stabilization system protein ParE
LAAIWLYVREHDAAAASRLCLALLKSAYSLSIYPSRNPRLPGSRDTHRMVEGRYLIYYRIREDAHLVTILRFWHGAQNPRHFRLQEASPAYPAVVTQASP